MSKTRTLRITEKVSTYYERIVEIEESVLKKMKKKAEAEDGGPLTDEMFFFLKKEEIILQAQELARAEKDGEEPKSVVIDIQEA